MAPSPPVLVVRHSRTEEAGTLLPHLTARGIAVRHVRIDEGDELPERPDGLSGLVLMGGTMSVNDPLPWIERECALVRRAIDAGLPVLGVCLGGQIIAKALGARVRRNPVPEIGWYPVRRVPAPGGDPWFAPGLAEFEVLHWHGETFDLPPGAERVLESDLCANQGFVLGDRVLGLQCHVEMTAEMVRTWVDVHRETLERGGPGIQSPEEILARLEERVATLARAAEPTWDRFSSLVRERLG